MGFRVGLIISFAVACWVAGPGLDGAVAAAESPAKAKRSVIVAFYSGDEPSFSQADTADESGVAEKMLERLGERKKLSIGWLGANQGTYHARQALLDMTTGYRLSRSGYTPRDVPPYGLTRTDGRWGVSYWEDVVDRAASAPAPIQPGLLAEALGGSAGFAGIAVDGEVSDHGLDKNRDADPAVNGYRQAYVGAPEAVLAANRSGRIAGVSLGSADTLLQRVHRLNRSHPLVVTTLPPGNVGGEMLDKLLADRTPQQLLIVLQRPHQTYRKRLLPMGIAGLGSERGPLHSRTTRRTGMVTGLDLAPTILQWLGKPIPVVVRGRPITVNGQYDLGNLQQMQSRLAVVRSRTYPALRMTLGAIVIVGLALVLRYGRIGLRRWLRIGGLTMLWFPTMALVSAAIIPSYWMELLLIAAGACVLAFLTDRFMRWPYGPLVPAFIGVSAYIIDAANNSALIINSVLGPNPSFGSRFFGFGNDLEAILPVMMMVGLAAALSHLKRSPKLALLFGAPMLAVTLMIAAGKLGAAVGGIFTAGVGAAVAVVLCLYARPSWRVFLVALTAPLAGVALLAAIDLSTGGDTHFTRKILSISNPHEFFQIAQRSLSLAWGQLHRPGMAIATGIAILSTLAAVRYRHRVFAPVAEMPVWTAALVGGVAAGIVGSLANDSGPELLIFATGVLMAATAYIQGDPRLGALREGRESSGADSHTDVGELVAAGV